MKFPVNGQELDRSINLVSRDFFFWPSVSNFKGKALATRLHPGQLDPNIFIIRPPRLPFTVSGLGNVKVHTYFTLKTTASSLFKTLLQGIMVVVFIKRNIQSKMMNTTTMIPCRLVSEKIGHSKISAKFQTSSTRIKNNKYIVVFS